MEVTECYTHVILFTACAIRALHFKWMKADQSAADHAVMTHFVKTHLVNV